MRDKSSMDDDKEPQSIDYKALLEDEKKRSEDYLNRLKYLQADFENLKKRFDRETEQIKCYCTERLVTQLLEVVDELELAVEAANSSDNPQKTLVEGVEMTLKKLKKVLEQEGVSAIEHSEGKVFDPACHNAIAAETREDAKVCSVIEEIRKGYTMKNKVLRPCIVRVAKPSE